MNSVVRSFFLEKSKLKKLLKTGVSVPRYKFNGSTQYLADSKLLYNGFTKNYKPSRLNHSTDDKKYLKKLS